MHRYHIRKPDRADTPAIDQLHSLALAFSQAVQVHYAQSPGGEAFIEDAFSMEEAGTLDGMLSLASNHGNTGIGQQSSFEKLMHLQAIDLTAGVLARVDRGGRGNPGARRDAHRSRRGPVSQAGSARAREIRPPGPDAKAVMPLARFKRAGRH